MYKVIAILSVLVAVATTLPTNDVNDLRRIDPTGDNDSVNNTGVVLNTQPKSLLLVALIPGIYDELIEEAEDSEAKARNARDCSFTFARDCSVKAANLTAVYAHDQEMLTKGFAHLSANRESALDVLRTLIDRALPA